MSKKKQIGAAAHNSIGTAITVGILLFFVLTIFGALLRYIIEE
jgi:hypothetical protein